MIIPHRGENQNYLAVTRDCTTQQRKSQLPSINTW